jgi:hypothetical protein
MYELMHNSGGNDALQPCDGTETLTSLLEKKEIFQLECQVSNLKLSDLNVPSASTEKQPFHILAMANYNIKCDLNLLMQMATEPNLSNNYFTQAQVVDLIRSKGRAIRDSYAAEIFAMFTIEIAGITRNLVACICCSGSYIGCVIYDLDDELGFKRGNRDRRSVLIKTY